MPIQGLLKHFAKPFEFSLHRFVVALFCLSLFYLAAQGTEAKQAALTLKIVPGSAGRLIIQGASEPTTIWSFRDSYAGVLGLGNRIENLTLTGADDSNIRVRKIAPGQFESTAPATQFRYEVDLSPRAIAADAARVSWLTGERGLLMLADLLPISLANAKDAPISVRLDLPAAWSAYSIDKSSGDQLEIQNLDRAVITVGKHLRRSTKRMSGMSLNFIADGDWAFQDSEAIEMAEKILRAHASTFGSVAVGEAALILFPFPEPVDANKWSAETRGATVTLLMGKLPSKVAALAQLSTPLTHELFHLWVPNALALKGDYDWFYEGFTIYQAARTAVRMDFLTFNEFLNAIARAYDGYRPPNEADRWSLIEASKRRWTTGETSVYSKSFVIAFLYDLRLRSLSRGKRSLDNVYRDLFRRYGSAQPKSNDGAGEVDGNDATTNALTAAMGADDFVRNFVRSPGSINLAAELAPLGLKVDTLGLRTHIRVDDKLGKWQRDLLRELGYNELTHAPRPR